MRYRIDGTRKALEALAPIRRGFERVHPEHRLDRPPRITCNCTFDGPAVGLSTIHCFNCDGMGYYLDFCGFSIEARHFDRYFAAGLPGAGIDLEWSPFPDSRTRWVP